MAELYTKWNEQCEAAERIAERYGTRKALGYLIGEMFLDHLWAEGTYPELVVETRAFTSRIKELFEPHVLRGHLEDPGRLGPLGCVIGDEPFEEFREAGAVLESASGGQKMCCYSSKRRSCCFKRCAAFWETESQPLPRPPKKKTQLGTWEC